MKYIFTLCTALLLFAFPFLITAQPSGNQPGKRGDVSTKTFIVKGKIVAASDNRPLEYATFTLFSVSDSSMAGGSISDLDGNFELKVRPGRFFARVEFISYRTRVIDSIVVSKKNPQVDLGEIPLSDNAAVLDVVEVRAEKSQMQMSLDKKVFNVGKDLASRGGTAAEILDNVPSVTVDIEGNVSLRGSENVRILIDGKPSGLIGVGDLNGLRSIPANLIERVEVITNPSARYEAEGMSGIINIVLRKDKKGGLNGSVDVNAGLPEIYGGAINLNYRKNKVNLFANYGLNYRLRPGGGFNYQERNRDKTLYITDQTSDRERAGWSHNIRFGSDFFINKYNTITGSFNLRISDENNTNNIFYRDYIDEQSPAGLQRITRRLDEEREDENNLEYALNYKKTFDKKGQQLTADYQFQDNGEIENSLYTETYFPEEGADPLPDNFLQRSRNDEGEKRSLIKVDYVHPVGTDGKFETGMQTSLRNIRNEFKVEEFADGEWLAIDSLTNNLQYEEDIYAAYLSYGNKINKFSYQLGLRGEFSHIQVLSEQNRGSITRDTFNLFPSAFISYEFKGQNNLQLSYSRRINRPRFWYLNPFFTFSDDRNQFGGNPYLVPEYTDAYEISYIKYWDKASISSSIYFRNSKGTIQRLQSISDSLNADGETITVTRPQNLNGEKSYGLEFTYSLSPKKWLRINGDFNFFRSVTDGTNYDLDFRAEALSMTGRSTVMLTALNNTDFQFRLNYRAPRNTVQGRNRSIYSIDIGVSKDILKNNGTVTLSVRDLLNSRKWRREIFLDDFYSNSEFQWRARSVILSFNYRINKKKERARGRGYDGGGDEY